MADNDAECLQWPVDRPSMCRRQKQRWQRMLPAGLFTKVCVGTRPCEAGCCREARLVAWPSSPPTQLTWAREVPGLCPVPPAARWRLCAPFCAWWKLSSLKNSAARQRRNKHTSWQTVVGPSHNKGTKLDGHMLYGNTRSFFSITNPRNCISSCGTWPYPLITPCLFPHRQLGMERALHLGHTVGQAKGRGPMLKPKERKSFWWRKAFPKHFWHLRIWITLVYTGETARIIWGEKMTSDLLKVNSIIERKAEGIFCLYPATVLCSLMGIISCHEWAQKKNTEEPSP